MAALIVFVSLISCARAEYRILFLNTPTINIGGKALKVNDVFSADSEVKWMSPAQAMRVADTKTGANEVFVGKEFSKAGVSTASAYHAKKRSTAASAPEQPVKSLASFLNDTFYLLDRLEIATGVPTDSNHYFFISYMHKGQELAKAVQNDNGTITLTPQLFISIRQPCR